MSELPSSTDGGPLAMKAVPALPAGPIQVRVEPLDAGDAARRLFAAGGEMGALMAGLDWDLTPVGPVAEWSQNLKTVISLLLTSQQPIFVWWGPDLVQFYNDAYRPILGEKLHPAALGQRGTVTWSGIWDVIEPMINEVRQGGSTRVEDGLLVIDRNGYPEECYFDYAYSPIRDEGGDVGGIFAACGDVTTRVIGERRLRLLENLSADVNESLTVQNACERATQTLSMVTYDVPFAAIFLADDSDKLALASAVGLAPSDLMPESWPLDQVGASGPPVILRDLQESGRQLAGGPWPEPAHTVVMVALAGGTTRNDGVVLLGVSPRRALDDKYLSFLSAVASQLSAAITSARVRADNTAKAESHAALDQAKTAFVANVSHEFRTPLTLLLGPLERALARDDIDPSMREELDAANRNAQRLLRLTNAFLDFAQMEDGRLDATFEPVDLPLLTAEVTKSFQAVFEHSGVDLIVDCQQGGDPVFVDVELWEKIILNLLSNAFKFTLTGSVTVTTCVVDNYAQLSIADTGEGISAAEIPRLFERFHRVWGTRSRSSESSGIGLAFVRELVTLHGGTIVVRSTPGVGTTFIIDIPLGADHLPADQCRGPRNALPEPSAPGFAAEAMMWQNDDISNPDSAGSEPLATNNADSEGRPIILVVDDNQDMRNYLSRVLGEHYVVHTASDGSTALASVENCKPHLVITDVMMPNIDGLELTQRLRAQPTTAHIPIIMLSARAGVEAAVDGLGAGADDYLTKPFTTAELLARCRTNIELAELRSAAISGAEQRYEQQHAIALLLEAALLPEALPTLDNLTLAAHYQAYTQNARIGGDWYDVVDLGGGNILAVIGDVVGHDLRAAATMARFRNAIRAYAIEDPSPASILNRIDQFVERLESEFATVLIITLNAHTGEFKYANAGHLPPLIAPHTGAVRALNRALYPPLGLSPQTRTEAIDQLQPGDTLLLYTDGLIERRYETITDGIARLSRAFEASAQSHATANLPQQLAEDLVSDRVDDDIAILAIAYTPPKL